MDINVITLSGRLTSDPELISKGDLEILKFSIACSEGKEKHTSFFNCTLFGKYGSIMSQYLRKGLYVIVSGNLKQSRWQAQDGGKRSSIEVLVKNMNITPGQNNNNNIDNQKQNKDQYEADNFTDDELDDEVPF